MWPLATAPVLLAVCARGHVGSTESMFEVEQVKDMKKVPIFLCVPSCMIEATGYLAPGA